MLTPSNTQNAFVWWSVQARRRGRLVGGGAAVATEQDHTVMMGLVDEGDDDGSTINRLGRANRFLRLWGTVSEEDKTRYHKVIHADAKEVRVRMRARAPQTQT